jgi:dephospho-CoA kinase
MIRIGLTGGIGSGKSTVGAELAAIGATVIDADQISRRSTQPGGAAMPAILQQFGEDFVAPDGSLDRPRMREHVFAHPHARRQLEAIVHPLVLSEMDLCTEVAHGAGARSVVFDIPLLVEGGRWRDRLDRVLVVDCRLETQIERVRARSGWDAATTEAAIRNQCSRSRRVRAADAVIWNEGIDLPTLRTQVLRCAAVLKL